MRAISAFASRSALAVALVVPATPAATAAGGTAAQDAAKPAAARTIHIYRCTDAVGRVTLQNDRPCPKGTRQQQQVVEAPPVQAYVPREEPMSATVAPGRTEAADTTAGTTASTAAGKPAARPKEAGSAPLVPAPPPQLYACRTWDERDLLTEDATPAERCAPLQVIAADGSMRSDASACEKVTDQCQIVPAEALCTAWQRRVDEAEFRWRFAGAKQDDDRRREYELLKATLAQSDCAR